MAFGAGRLGTYIALGGASGTIPLPWIPYAFERRLRGALAHDIAAHHQIALSPEARTILADPEPPGKKRTVLRHAATFATTRVLSRFGPLNIVRPIHAAAVIFALGHLLDRYLETARRRSGPIGTDEALFVRQAIDQAIVDAWKTSAPFVRSTESADEPVYDPFTQRIDAMLMAAAGIPDWIVRRLNSAFDEQVRSGHG